MTEFVEFVGKKEYKCPKCKGVIRYAKFFGEDKKVLTTDGKEPYFDQSKKPMSNTGWPTNPVTKRMHECKSKLQLEPVLNNLETLDSGWGDNRRNTFGGAVDKIIKFPDVEHNSQPLNDMDKKVMLKMEDDAYHDAQFMIWTLQGVEKACRKLSIEVGPISGMIFKEVCENIRRRNERVD